MGNGASSYKDKEKNHRSEDKQTQQDVNPSGQTIGSNRSQNAPTRNDILLQRRNYAIEQRERYKRDAARKLEEDRKRQLEMHNTQHQSNTATVRTSSNPQQQQMENNTYSAPAQSSSTTQQDSNGHNRSNIFSQNQARTGDNEHKVYKMPNNNNIHNSNDNNNPSKSGYNPANNKQETSLTIDTKDPQKWGKYEKNIREYLLSNASKKIDRLLINVITGEVIEAIEPGQRVIVQTPSQPAQTQAPRVQTQFYTAADSNKSQKEPIQLEYKSYHAQYQGNTATIRTSSNPQQQNVNNKYSAPAQSSSTTRQDSNGQNRSNIFSQNRARTGDNEHDVVRKEQTHLLKVDEDKQSKQVVIKNNSLTF